MNLYSVLNQDLRDLQRKKLAEAEVKKYKKVIKESEEDEIGYRLVEIDEALKTAAPDEKEALEKEKAELLSRLNDITDKKECDSSLKEDETSSPLDIFAIADALDTDNYKVRSGLVTGQSHEDLKLPLSDGSELRYEDCDGKDCLVLRNEDGSFVKAFNTNNEALDYFGEGENCKEDEECPDCNSTVEILKGLKDSLDTDGEVDIEALKSKVDEAIASCNVPEEDSDDEASSTEKETIEDCSLQEGNKYKYITYANDPESIGAEYEYNKNSASEVNAILQELKTYFTQASIDGNATQEADALKTCASKVQEIIDVFSKASVTEGENCKNCKEEGENCKEDFQECEINGYKITRVSPSTKTYMIEAQTADGLKYIVGKNFNEETKELDEAEIIDNHDKALSTFKDLLKK